MEPWILFLIVFVIAGMIPSLVTRNMRNPKKKAMWQSVSWLTIGVVCVVVWLVV